MPTDESDRNLPVRLPQAGELAVPDLGEFDIEELEERLEFTAMMMDVNVGVCSTNTCPNTNCTVSCAPPPQT
jgi:hypothetical protein